MDDASFFYNYAGNGMGVRWASGLMRWKPHVGKSGTCSLSHLHPFRFDLVLPAHGSKPELTVSVHVGFSTHTFTCGLENAGPDPEIYEDDREQRAFDLQRYEMSKGLPAIIKSLDTRHCYFAAGDGFFTLELAGLPPGHDYRVFFAVQKKSPTEIQLVVKSAYVGRIDQLPTGARRKKVGFRVIIGKCLAGQPLKAPPF